MQQLQTNATRSDAQRTAWLTASVDRVRPLTGDGLIVVENSGDASLVGFVFHCRTRDLYPGSRDEQASVTSKACINGVSISQRTSQRRLTWQQPWYRSTHT